MHAVFLPRGHSATTVPVTFVNAATWRDLRERLDARARAFADAAGFEPKAGRHLLRPAADGALAGVLFALEAEDDASRICSGRVHWRRCCRRAPIASPTP